MVSCKHCSTPNSLDSTFCKRCGTALPAEDVQIAQEKLTALIAEGNNAFNEGRTDEAMAIAESAYASNPSSTAALSLKSLCHERRGELAEALECADLIVDLNPDSELDKIKRNQLRTKLSVSVQLATQPPDRRTALIGAVAAVVLFICIGVWAAKVSARNATTKAESLIAQGPVVQSSGPSQQSQVSPNNNQTNQSGAQGPSKPQTEQNSTDQETNRGGLTKEFAAVTPRSSLNNDNLIGLSGDLPVTPPAGTIDVRPTVTSTVKTPSTVATPDKSTTVEDPAPKPEDPRQTQVQNNDPGQVEIKISQGSSRKSSFGGTESFNAGGASALDKIGIQRYQLGSYGAAATSFEQALRSGGDQVTLNQWLARCYGNMGRKNDQIDAYKRCVSACQSAIASGSGNKDRIHSILDTCQQELKVLQGN